MLSQNLTNKKLKNSTNNPSSRYVIGGSTEVSPQFLEWWNKDFLKLHPTDVTYVLEKKFENRPDLLADTFYDNPYLWWVIPLYNSILDFNSEFIEGVILRVPTKDRIDAIAHKNLGGIKSQKLK